MIFTKDKASDPSLTKQKKIPRGIFFIVIIQLIIKFNTCI